MHHAGESPAPQMAESQSSTTEVPRETSQVELGQWYWAKSEDGPQLACVTHIGSNYFELSSPRSQHGSSHWRIHFDRVDEDVDRREFSPDLVIEARIRKHQEAVKSLLNDVRRLTSNLGLTPAGELTDGSQSTALVAAHNARDVKAHKNALIKAKEKTLPDLFEKIEKEHEQMATWLKAQLLPMQAQADTLKKSTESIEDSIFTVELYAGLCEEVTCIRKGEPASNDEKIRLFQRRHYMDEECLVNYSAGGMEFDDIRDFDRWLMRKGNRERILPMPKCIVAFQVRRNRKHREVASMGDFIRFGEMAKEDESTFLYMRNGDRYYRLETAIDFGEQLFPDEDRSHLMSGKLWVSEYGSNIVTDAEHADQVADEKKKRREYKAAVAEYKKLSKAQKVGKMEPWYSDSIRDTYIPLTPETVYYDDGMGKLAEETRDHNRIAVVLQGLLDRSPVFQPHPPWRLWTPEGFANGIELVYDDSRAIVAGDDPDFEAYRDRLNASIVKGTNTVGQQLAWEKSEARKENDRQSRDWRIRSPLDYKRYKPSGNPGPGDAATVASVSRDKKHCVFVWWRTRLCATYYDSGDIKARFRCASRLLLNADAYVPGDYKQFYADPRTRADYLKWAPLLLAAEDFAKKR